MAAACAAAVAALAAGCSSSSNSTAPTGTTSFAFAGSWQLQWVNLSSGVYVTPAVDTITITQSGSSYTVTYKDFTFQTSPSIYYSYTALGGSIAAAGDTLKVHAYDATDPGACYLAMVGTASGTTLQGTATQAGGAGCPTIWSWSFTATKQ